MKRLGRLLVFALAIFVGVAAAWVGSLFTAPLGVPDLTEPVSWDDAEPTSSVSPSGVIVTYAGLGTDVHGGPYLKFIVHNGLNWPLTYGAQSADSPSARLKANGNELPVLGRCGTGIQSFYILPGRSAEFHVYQYEFTELPQKNDRISVGFYLKSALADEYGTYYSESFLLPKVFRDLIERSKQ